MALASMLLFTAALAGQVHPQDTPLNQVVQRSSLIVVVRAADPHHRSTQLDIPGPQPLDPFQVEVQRVEVLEVLHDPSGRVEQGATLEVASGSLETDYDVHVLYHRDGISKSPIVARYASPVSSVEPAPTTWVALLRTCKVATWDAHCSTVANARELVGNRKKIEAAMTSRTRKSNATSSPRTR